MGPYYRNTSQGVGSFFEMFYQYPVLMLILVAGVGAAAYLFLRKKGQ